MKQLLIISLIFIVTNSCNEKMTAKKLNEIKNKDHNKLRINKFGLPFNSFRAKNGLPLLRENAELVSHSIYISNYSEQNIGNRGNFSFRKILAFFGDTLNWERTKVISYVYFNGISGAREVSKELSDSILAS